jgi:hypothetical protein
MMGRSRAGTHPVVRPATTRLGELLDSKHNTSNTNSKWSSPAIPERPKEKATDPSRPRPFPVFLASPALHMLIRTRLVLLALLTRLCGAAFDQSKDQLTRHDEEILKSVKLPGGYEAAVFAKPRSSVTRPASAQRSTAQSSWRVDENGSIDRESKDVDAWCGCGTRWGRQGG